MNLRIFWRELGAKKRERRWEKWPLPAPWNGRWIEGNDWFKQRKRAWLRKSETETQHNDIDWSHGFRIRFSNIHRNLVCAFGQSSADRDTKSPDKFNQQIYWTQIQHHYVNGMAWRMQAKRTKHKRVTEWNIYSESIEWWFNIRARSFLFREMMEKYERQLSLGLPSSTTRYRFQYQYNSKNLLFIPFARHCHWRINLYAGIRRVFVMFVAVLPPPRLPSVYSYMIKTDPFTAAIEWSGYFGAFVWMNISINRRNKVLDVYSEKH